MGKSRTGRPLLGFTLIELMVTVAIVAILAAIAYPSFIEQIRKSRRADAKTGLNLAAQNIERDYTLNNSYASAVATVLGASGVQSPERHYQITVNSSTATTYTIDAAPQAPQNKDLACATFRLDNIGNKSVTGTRPATECW